MSKQELNIRHALVIGLALNRNCTDIINDIYYKNENLYHEAYLDRGLHEDHLKKIFTMKTEDMVNKLSGIIEVCYTKNDTLPIEKIIRKAHPSIVNYVKKSNVVDLDKFNLIYKIHELQEDENFSCGVALIYLTNRYNKNMIGSSYVYFVLNKWSDYLRIMKSSYIENTHTNKELMVIDKITTKGYDLFDLNREDKFDENLEHFIADAIERKVFEKFGIDDYTKIETKLNVDIEEYEKVRSNEFNLGVNRYIGSFSRYVHSLGLDSADIMVDVAIDNEILEDIFKDFSYSIMSNNVDEDKLEIYVASCLFIYDLVKLYQECKDIYLNKTAEDRFKELKQMEEDLISEKEKFKEKVFENKLAMKESKSEIDTLKKRVKELEKQNAKLSSNADKDKQSISGLKNELKESKENISELQEVLNNVNQVAVTKEELSINDKIDYINDYRIGIFGGMTNIKELSDKLENIVYYNSMNQDISSINGLDMIFINTDFINHAFSNKIKSACAKLGIEKRYMLGTNDDVMINTIYKELYKHKKDLD